MYRPLMLNLLIIASLFLSPIALANLAWQYQPAGEITGQPVIHKNIIYVLTGQS